MCVLGRSEKSIYKKWKVGETATRRLGFKEMDNCVVFNKCNFQNGESPYGSVVLSRNPNQTEVDEDGGK